MPAVIPTPQQVAEVQAELRLVDDEAKPLAGSDIEGRGKHQYIKLALVGWKDRYFVCFAESQRLYDSLHTKLGSPAWVREGFDQRWIYIEEVLHKPISTDTMDGYLQGLPQKDNYIWLAVFNYLLALGLFEKSARKVLSKNYGIPKG
jgi:hypothetical protein